MSENKLELIGGKKRTKTSKSKTSKKSTGKAVKPKQTRKSGGAFMDDVKSLAVPFAILLAKQGLDAMTSKETTAVKSKASSKTPTAKKPSSLRRRSTAMSGGGCSACTANLPITGGSRNSNSRKIQDSFSKIAADIDKFLAKY